MPLDEEATKTLFRNTADGNFQCIQQAIVDDDNEGVDVVMSKGMHHETLLHTAAHRGFLDIVHLLIQNGADVNAKSKNGTTPLHSACGASKLDVAHVFIKNGININATNDDGFTPLHAAVLDAKVDVIQYLLQEGADPNIPNGEGSTPMCTAINSEEINGMEVMRLLVEHGASTDEINSEGNDALYMAIEFDDLAFVQCLMRRGTNPLKLKNNGVDGIPLRVAYITDELNSALIVEELVRNITQHRKLDLLF